MKALERDRAKLQKTASIQLMQIEKHRALADESARKKHCNFSNGSHKQAMAVQSTVEGRLNRALEETENLKTQLNEMKQMSKMHFEAAKLLSFTEEEFVKFLNSE
uniref:Testis expressed 9 n=1 Tax=Mola mola TaxID=94237 RepID=A0A3Q3WEV3_MOLML